MRYPMYHPCLPMYSMYNLSHVLSFLCYILAFLCITLPPFDVFTCIILACQPIIKSPVTLKNKATYTATVEQKRLRRFSCCLVLTLFRVTLFNLRLFITIPQYLHGLACNPSVFLPPPFPSECHLTSVPSLAPHERAVCSPCAYKHVQAYG
jgi:hypothetical protein